MGPIKSGLRRSLPFFTLVAPVLSSLRRFVYLDYKLGLFDGEVSKFITKA